MTADQFQKQFNVSRETFEKLQTYEILLQKWQKKINLISPATVKDIWSRHFADSAQLYDFIEDKEMKIADIGAGAGFPGMVLAIMGCQQVTLIESDQRKCLFLKNVARQTDTNCNIINARIETVEEQFDCVTARALADLDSLLRFVDQLTTSRKTLFLKGEKAAQEIEAARQNWHFDYHMHESITHDGGYIVSIEHLKCFT